MRSAQLDEPISVLDRITSILDAFDDQGSLTITEISRRTGLPKSTTSRLVSDLVSLRYLERDEDGIHLGMRLFELGRRVFRPLKLRSLVLPALLDLRNATGERTLIAINEGAAMVPIALMAGEFAQVPVVVGGRVSALTSALGKAYFAFSPDLVARRVAVSELGAPALSKWEAELNSVRASGVAFDRGSTFPGVVGIASPVLSAARVPVASVSLTIREGDADPDRLAPLVRATAVAMSRRLSEHHAA